MTATIDILRGELERLFSLEEMTNMSETLLGLAPDDVGGTAAKASFARALTERCLDGERIEALVDIIRVSKREVDPRIFDLSGILGREDLAAGRQVGDFVIQRKLGESELAVVYLAVREQKSWVLKVLRREASRDRRSVHRFLTANRLVGAVEHDGLPKGIQAGELEDGQFYVAYGHVDALPLSQRLARTGPTHINELRPTLRGILEALAALHRAHLVHGDLKLENVLAGKEGVTLIDFGTDRLRQRSVSVSGHTGLLAVFGSPKTIAPELVRGRLADPRSDVYAFGSMLYELLSGKPVFVTDNATDAVFSHLSREPEAPSTKAPRGFIPRDVDDFVLMLLAKDPARRPKDAQGILDALDALGRASMIPKAGAITEERVDALIEALLRNVADAEAALALEKAVEQGASALKVAAAFMQAAEALEITSDDARETKKGLLYRAARTFDGAAKDKAQAETAYVAILAVDPQDEIAAVGLEEVRKALGKFEELVEMLLERSQNAEPGEGRARALAEIGRLYAGELDDAEQATVAYVQALCEVPSSAEYASLVEGLCGSKAARWNEALTTITETIKEAALSQADRNALLMRAASWYDTKLNRADLALMAYSQVLSQEPSHEAASEGLSFIYRRAQQWPELASMLTARADAAGATPKGRDLRTEAAELFESKLNDGNRARDLYEAVLSEDPGHIKASDGMARQLERTGDFAGLVRVLDGRAEARRGLEKAEALCKVAEVQEDHLGDLPEATRRYEAALAVDPKSLAALKGLDRIFNRTGRYRELLEVLERQIAVAATPRQKVALFERMAGLYDEEFLDHASAAQSLEEILKIDQAHDQALTGLVRHYRALDRWDRVTALLERHSAVTSDESRKVELMVARARALAEHVGSPERAMKVYEEVLRIQPDNAGSLEALAHLREATGDAHAALSAIEALAAKAQTTEGKAEQWMRAARLLETRGDKDGAIERYKLALDASPKDTVAASALRKAYAERGDWGSVITLVERELQYAEGDLAKARLHGELARVYARQLGDEAKAEAAAKRAVTLDPTCAEALMVLGDIAFEAGRLLEASKHLDGVIGRTSLLPKDDAVRVLVRFLEAFGTAMRPSAPPPSLSSVSSMQAADSAPMSQSRIPAASQGRLSVAPPAVTNPRIMTAIEALQQTAPKDVEALSRAANALFEFGDPHTALRLHEELIANHGKELAGADRAEALYHLGESARRAGDLDRAIAPLKEAADLDPSSPRPLRSLAKIHEERAEYEEAVRVKKRRLQIATGAERFELLLEIGDLEMVRIGDRARAAKTYVSALEERPDDRKLLAKLMQLYSEEKDWAKLIDVVTRLADFVEDPKQRAKYMHTAATIASKHLGQKSQAMGYYEQVIAADPTNAKALGELTELHRQKQDHLAVKRLLGLQLDQAKAAQDRAGIVKVLDQMGELYQKFLSEPEMAIDAFEAAQAFDPEDKTRADVLAELYASDPAQYLDKAVRAQAQILRRNPYKVESYKLLRKLYTESKRADSAWCLCQALSTLNLAEPDEERFFRKHRTETAAPAQAAFSEEEWQRAAHPDLDPLLLRIFATIQPTIMRVRTQSIEALGFDRRYAIDTSLHPYPISQTLYYAQGVLGMPSPIVFQNPNEPAALGFLHAQTPGIILGRGAFDTNVPSQSLAFMCGKHLTYLRAGYYVRHLVPTGTGLKAWLFAAIRMSVPTFPVAQDMAGPVAEAMAAMAQDFQGSAKDTLASLVSKLLQSGGALDLKKWVAAIDLTADRIGFVLAHDLGATTEMLRATEDASSVPVKERLKEVVLYSISEEYFELRKKLGLAVDG
jgi:tetratricopeptide (TPR) repeat protein